MSGKNISIKEGGTARVFGPVSRLRVLKQDTGSEDFALESDTELTSKSVDVNGTYDAAQDGYYGYSQVYVYCSEEADQVTGKKQDGNTYSVSKDEEGNIHETKIPVKIEITTMPTTLEYVNGQMIDYTGIVVTCYDGNGESMGEVPFSELLLDTKYAVFDPDAPTIEIIETTETDTSPIKQPIPCTGGIYAEAHGHEGGYADSDYTEYASLTFRSGSGMMAIMRRQYGYVAIVASSRDNSSTVRYYRYKVYVNYHGEGEKTEILNDQTISLSGVANINDETAYFSTWEGGVFDASGYVSAPFCNDGAVVEGVLSGFAYKLAWTLMYGVLIDAGNMEIPVKWQRKEDGAILETSYYIDVAEGV